MSSRLLASLTATAGFRKYFSADKKQSIVSKKDRSVADLPIREILSAAVGLCHLAHGWIAVQMLHV